MPAVDVGDAELFYAELGSGDPMVLVHGGFLDHTLWALAAPTLAEGFHVFALDLPGHGRSTGKFDPDSDGETLVADAADTVATFIEKLGVGPAHLGGQSAGGTIVLHLAARRPDLVQTMSLHEPVVIALLDEEFRDERELQRRAARLLSEGDTEAGLATFMSSVGGDWSQAPEPVKELFRRNAHNYAGAKSFDDPATLPVPDSLNAIAQPTLFTKGSASPRYFHVSIDRVAAAMPRAEIAILEGAAHAAPLGHAAAYAATVRDFVSRSQSSVPD